MRSRRFLLWMVGACGAVLVVGLVVGQFGADSKHLEEQLRADPMLAEELIPGYRSPHGRWTRKDPLGGVRVTVGRSYRGPVRPLQEELHDSAIASGWRYIEVVCRQDGFTMRAKRRLGDRPVSLRVNVRYLGDEREVRVEVEGTVEGGTDIGDPPDSSDTCE